ncbi:MAG: hypothetical protein JRN20_13745 [Nitrososphaerota archaeon]|nr:hypothetical protein [Nitrososphaerota archaeon]
MQREDTGVSHNAGGHGGFLILKSEALAFTASAVSLAVKEGKREYGSLEVGGVSSRRIPDTVLDIQRV